MASKTSYGVQPFDNHPRGRSGVVQPIVMKSGEEAIRDAECIAKSNGGTIAFSRTGDDDLDDPAILGRFGDVPREFE